MIARCLTYLAKRKKRLEACKALEADRARRLAKVPQWQKYRAAALKGLADKQISVGRAVGASVDCAISPRGLDLSTGLLACHPDSVRIYERSI